MAKIFSQQGIYIKFKEFKEHFYIWMLEGRCVHLIF